MKKIMHQNWVASWDEQNNSASKPSCSTTNYIPEFNLTDTAVCISYVICGILAQTNETLKQQNALPDVV
jgi:hypothetical protein